MSSAVLITMAGLLVLVGVGGVWLGYVIGQRAGATGSSGAKPADPIHHLPSEPMPAKTKPAPAIRTPAPTGGSGSTLAAISNWGYQLQNLDVAAAARTGFDLLVIDPTADGSAEGTLSRADIERLQLKPDGRRRLVVAYLSIGEAESYRPYWQKGWKRSKPDWLLGENPDWDENYAVCFWDAGWQGLMCGSKDAALDRILAAGFDGVYLDKADVFEDLERDYRKIASTRPDIAGDMVTFIERLSSYAKAKRPGFLVIMQNAETLLKSRELLGAIDGVAKEELLFGLDSPEKRNARDEVNEARAALDLAKRAGKPVMVVEYLDDPRKIADAASSIRALGYTLYVAPKDRELDRLNSPGIEV
jgi:cysteinyl-tRNA synthetase